MFSNGYVKYRERKVKISFGDSIIYYNVVGTSCPCIIDILLIKIKFPLIPLFYFSSDTMFKPGLQAEAFLISHFPGKFKKGVIEITPGLTCLNIA